MRKTHKQNRSYLRRRNIRRRNKTNKMNGGELIVSETDLKNRHICNQRTPEYRTSPGYELYTSIDTSFQLNKETIGFFNRSFRKTQDKWFKFIMFNNSGIEYIYIINGVPINKHAVPALFGLMEVTRETGEYVELRQSYQQLLYIKALQGIDPDNIEASDHVQQLNQMIATFIPCMPVISAGSGTVNDDNSICINTKSGHYKPDPVNMEAAKRLFEEISGASVNIILKIDKEALIAKYGEHAENMSGICL
jgi:hypothetical protein